MNYLAASNGVSIGKFLIAPRGGELNPCPPYFWRIYPPPEDLSASGGLRGG